MSFFLPTCTEEANGIKGKGGQMSQFSLSSPCFPISHLLHRPPTSEVLGGPRIVPIDASVLKTSHNDFHLE